MTEAQFQCCVKQFADMHKLPMHHSANEAKRSVVLGKRLKDMGMIPGFSDCFFLRGNQQYKGLFLELKIKPNKLTATQEQFLAMVNKEGYLGLACYSIDEALKIIIDFYSLVCV